MQMKERRAWIVALLGAAALAVWSVLGAIDRGSDEAAKQAALADPGESASPSRVRRRAAAEGTLLSGVVRDPQRQGVAGATVCAACAGCNATGPKETTCVRSASDGRYRFENIAPAAY